MMQYMALARCGVRISRAVLCLGFFALFLVQMLVAFEWSPQGASQAFEEARQKRNQIAQTTNPTVAQYLECARTFRKVYMRDPHFRSTGEAIYTEGRIYQEMGDRFSEREYYVTAIKRFLLLVEDYSGNQNCPDALRRMAAIYSKNLKNEAAAQEAYQRLRTEYGITNASAQKANREIAPKSAGAQTIAAQAPPAEARSGAKTLVQSVRYWVEKDRTRVTIDMDADTSYLKERLSRPERIYFDISNARASKDLQNRTIAVEDVLLKQIRIRQNSSEVVRIVLDISEASPYTVSELHNPFRLVIDLQRPAGAKTPQNPILQTSIANNRTTPTEASGAKKASLPVPASEIKKELPLPGAIATASNVPGSPKSSPTPAEVAPAKLPSSAVLRIPDKPTLPETLTDVKRSASPVPVSERKNQPATGSAVQTESVAPKSTKADQATASTKAVKLQPPSASQTNDKVLSPPPLSSSKEASASAKLTESKIQLPSQIVVEQKATANRETSMAPASSGAVEIAKFENPAGSKSLSNKPADPSAPSNAKQAPPTARMAELKVQLPPQVVTEAKPAKPEDSKPTPSQAVGGISGKSSVSITTDIEMKPPTAIPPPVDVASKSAPKTSRGDRTLTRMLGLKIGRIVLDPGHGGHDLGTIGPDGLLEKNLVLMLARDLQKRLQEKLGAEVVLTRNDDTFVSLEERTAIANQHRADLFISIHANSSRMRSISGVETYFLDFANTASESEVATRENAVSEKSVRDLEDLIKKIAQADKSAESRELASIVQKKLYAESRKFSPKTNNRGVRSAPFIVLIGANMPSVLAEVAFLSNPKDEKLLKKKTNREYLVNALFSGIEGYMKTLGSSMANQQAARSK